MTKSIFSNSSRRVKFVKRTLNTILLIAAQAISTPALVVFTSISGVLFASTAAAQTARNFPEAAVRGKISFKSPPLIEVDGKADRLTPGARIRDERNMLMMSGALEGKSFTVNFRREPSTGQVHEVWMLSEEEAKMKLAGENK